MAYVSVAEWRPEQVTEWLKGLDSCVLPYIHWFSNNQVNGQQLLNLSTDDLTHLGVQKLGHQELILEAVQHLRNFHYELDRENLQLLALQLSCAAHSLYNEMRDQPESSFVPTQILADVAHVVNTVKPLVSWLDRPPFSGQTDYSDYKTELLGWSLEMAICAQRDRFAEKPVTGIRTLSSKLAVLADKIIQDIPDPMLLQPATLDLATIKKRTGEDLGLFLIPSFHGIHQIGDMKLSSPAHQSGKIQQGDEIVQVNYQTVVGWARKKVLALFEESPNDLLLTLKRRPRHVKVYGQIYMKPYRLPSRKRSSPYSRWNENLPSPRPELLTIPHFELPRAVIPAKKETFTNDTLLEQSTTSSSSDEDFGQPLESQSPASMRLYLPKPRAPIQRRFTLSGPPQPSAHSEQFWLELQLERSWRSNQNNSEMNGSECRTQKDKVEMFHLRDKSASFGHSIAAHAARPATCMPFPSHPPLAKASDSKLDNVIGKEREADSAVVNGPASVRVVKSGTKLSIVELNKLKREAFFNNMDCSVSSRAKEEEEMKSPGKVSQLINNFEMRKEPYLKPEGRVTRGRLDKSCSTPAYDLSDTELGPGRNMCDDEVLEQRWKTERQSERESHGQMVNTINDYLLPDGDLYGKIDHYGKVNTPVPPESPTKKMTGEILDTVNLALVELHDDEEEVKKTECAPLLLKRPVPAQRNIKTSPDINIPGPLPPKPRPRPVPPPLDHPKPHPRTTTPPEPPPRPESTFLRTPTRLSPRVETTEDTCAQPSPLPSPAGSSVPPTPDHSDTRFLVPPPERESARPPPVPILSVTTDKHKSSGGGTLESLRAMLTLGRKPMSFNSPRSLRKKNSLLAKRRNVSVKDLSPCETCGYLAHRNRKGSATASWTRGFFLLQASNFYGFKTRESHKADLFVYLPGFTCTVAEEVKSRPFAFKIYHTGTVFYFSADSEESMQQWLDSVTLATVGQDDRRHPDNLTFSETDSDTSDTEPELETCFPTSPKMKKFLGSSPTPKPARSHQNLSSESKKSYDSHKKFGSLKKYGSSSQKQQQQVEPAGLQTDVASLDRKRLRFLGQKNSPVPVPTSQFRSYRRMQPAVTAPPQAKQGAATEGAEFQCMAARGGKDAAKLTRRTMHSSNPSLAHPDMADYRVTQERLAEFRRIRNQDRPIDLSGFMTLEQFMLARQEEERLMRSNASSISRQPSQQMSEVVTIDQFVSSQEERPSSRTARARVYPSTSSHPPREVAPPPRPPLDRKQLLPSPLTTPPPHKTKLKSVTQYQPPPLSPNQTDDAMSFAFEMTLDQISGKATPTEANGADCGHVHKEVTPDYPGLEYPPAFEPETYTLQCMLNNRRRRDAAHRQN